MGSRKTYPRTQVDARGEESKSSAMFDQVRRYQTIHYPCQSLASISTMMTTPFRPVAQPSKEIVPEAVEENKPAESSPHRSNWPLITDH
jgi:hypothetical protein